MSFFCRLTREVGMVALFCAAFQAYPSSAQTPAWSVPSSGFLPDALSHSIRPVAGFTGSALVGAAVLNGLDWASVAPNQQSAIVGKDGVAMWVANLRNLDQTQTLTGLAAAARRVIWAADSSSAVMLTADSQVIWVTNLTTSPALQTAIQTKWDLTAYLLPGSSGNWRLLAADSAADHILLAAPEGGDSGLWTTSRTVQPMPVALSLVPAAAAFTSSNDSAFVADGTTHQVIRVQGLNGSPSMTTLIASEDYVSDPSAIALSAAGDRFFLANTATTKIREFDSSTGTLLVELIAEESPRSLSLVSPGRFLFEPDISNAQNPSSRPILILDTAEPAKILFIPRGQ